MKLRKSQQIRFDEPTVERLKALAARYGVKVGWLVRQAVNEVIPAWEQSQERINFAARR